MNELSFLKSHFICITDWDVWQFLTRRMSYILIKIDYTKRTIQ